MHSYNFINVFSTGTSSIAFSDQDVLARTLEEVNDAMIDGSVGTGKDGASSSLNSLMDVQSRGTPGEHSLDGRKPNVPRFRTAARKVVTARRVVSRLGRSGGASTPRSNVSRTQEPSTELGELKQQYATILQNQVQTILTSLPLFHFSPNITLLPTLPPRSPFGLLPIAQQTFLQFYSFHATSNPHTGGTRCHAAGHYVSSLTTGSKAP